MFLLISIFKSHDFRMAWRRSLLICWATFNRIRSCYRVAYKLVQINLQGHSLIPHRGLLDPASTENLWNLVTLYIYASNYHSTENYNCPRSKHVFITTKNGALLHPRVGKVNLLQSSSFQANATIGLWECILTISLCHFTLLQVAELQEMSWPMVLMVVFSRSPKLDTIFHAHCMLHSHEVIVPWTVVGNLKGQGKDKMINTSARKLCTSDDSYKFKQFLIPYHVETKEPVTQKHLDLLIVSWKISMGIASCVLVNSSPLITTWSKLVCS